MKANKALIITSANDPHSDFIIDRFNKEGFSEKVVRLNTEDFLGNVDISYQNKSFRIHLKDSKRNFSSDEILSVWFRRPQKINSTVYDQPEVNLFCEQQANAVLRGLYFCLHDTAIWINPLPSIHRARIKLQQLTTAKALGFDVPETLVTNNPQEALLFFDVHELICNKSLDEPNFYLDGKLYPYLTRLIRSRSEIEDAFDAIKICPTLFQQYIAKLFDVRVVVVGYKIFAFEIHSQTHELSKIDFRGKSPENMIHRPHILPDYITELILEFMKRQQLVYSAFDFVYAEDKRYYFLENNCNGQWLWLELMTDVRISDALMDILCNGLGNIENNK